jgi:hypothetical protein
MKNLTQNEIDMLWGIDEPYSEAKLVLNTRILGGGISRVMVEVQGHINPTTFRMVKKHRHGEVFSQDFYVQNLLDSAAYWGKKDGYVVALGGEDEYSEDPMVMHRAEEKLRVLKEAIFRMHQFVMEELGLE